jgi:hypothetical protein
MKTWQHGYELDYLKSIEEFYSTYNSFTDSPFAKYKKNNIAQDLNEGIHQHIIDGSDEVRYVVKTTKVKTPITLYSDVVIGYKEPRDVVLTKLAASTKHALGRVLEGYRDKNVWLYVWAEDPVWSPITALYEFDYIGSKITTFGEIYSIYFRNAKHSINLWNEENTRKHPHVDPIENVTLAKIGHVDSDIIETIKNKLTDSNLNFTNHYSNYNKGKSWSALSLRGYSPDFTCILKPSEMNTKWKEEHKNEDFHLQDTELYNNFPEIRTMISSLFDGDVHRVRFMQLKPGGGELERHTDQVDNESGFKYGQIMRFHFPIITNEKMLFNAWDLTGSMIECNMKIGEYWLLDTRKPHRAINNGSENRIHLVIDVEMTPKLKNMIMG